MMNPLEGLKDWHIAVIALLAGFGIIGVLIMIAKAVVFLIKHVQII